jgi:hypothetical protein
LEAFLLADNDEDARAQRQRALLHNAPKAPPREPQPGELLMTFEHGQDVYRVELRDDQPHGVETQIFINGELLAAPAHGHGMLKPLNFVDALPSGNWRA